MDTNLVPYQATDLIRLSTVAAELDIGDELDWQPDHLAPSAWHEHIPFAFWLARTGASPTPPSARRPSGSAFPRAAMPSTPGTATRMPANTARMSSPP
jgi:hypothetical protein